MTNEPTFLFRLTGAQRKVEATKDMRQGLPNWRKME
jgi:hypothetical protein